MTEWGIGQRKTIQREQGHSKRVRPYRETSSEKGIQRERERERERKAIRRYRPYLPKLDDL